ncbi:MAG: hypothetical protein AB7K09_00710, partial [Planctomycetota bacterium]
SSPDLLAGLVGWGDDEIGAYLRLLWFIKIRLDEHNRQLGMPSPGSGPGGPGGRAMPPIGSER